MSSIARLRGASRLVVVGLALRLVLGLTAGLVPASWASDTTRFHPRGELALSDNGAMLLFDVFAHGSMPLGAGRISLALAVFAAAVGLVPFGATVLALREPGPVLSLLAESLRRLGTSLLTSGLSLLALALVLLTEVMAFGPMVTSLARTSVLTPMVAIAFALPLPALVGLAGDALRVRALVADEGLTARFEQTYRRLRGRIGGLFVRYLLAAGVQTLAALGAATLALMVIARPVPVLAAGLLASAMLLAIAAFARAWLLGHVVTAVSPPEARPSGDAHEPGVEALHGPQDVGYEAASTREPR